MYIVCNLKLYVSQIEKICIIFETIYKCFNSQYKMVLSSAIHGKGWQALCKV